MPSKSFIVGCVIGWGSILTIAGLVCLICAFAIYKPIVDQKALYWTTGNCTVKDAPFVETDALPTTAAVQSASVIPTTPSYWWCYNNYYQIYYSVQYYNYVNYWSTYYYSNPSYYSYGYGNYDDYGGIPSSSGYSDDGDEYADEDDGEDDADGEDADGEGYADDGDDGADDGGDDDADGGDDGGDDGGGDDDKKRSVQQSTLYPTFDASYYYRPLYMVELSKGPNNTVSVNATFDHANNGWVAGTDVDGSALTTPYLVNQTYPCYYNKANPATLPAGDDQLAYFSYDVSQREQEFVGYMASGIVMLCLGGVSIIGAVLACFIFH